MDEQFSNPWYPYHKVIAANTLKGAERLPYQLLLYLLDLPDAKGYQPIDDNERARVRLAKYLWYDQPNPLNLPLPTPEQKRSMLFDPDAPAPNSDEEQEKHPKGYRMIWQRVRGQSQLEAKSLIKCYMGRIYEPRKFVTTIGVYFEVCVNVNLETNTRTNAYQRSFDIEQCIREALDGVNMTGIGTISFSRYDHSENGSDFWWDESSEVGRRMHCSVTWAEGGGNTVQAYDGECW